MARPVPVEHGSQEFGYGIVLDVIFRESKAALPFVMPFLEVLVVGQHSCSADGLEIRHAGKPVPDLSDGELIVAMMGFDVGTGEVGDRRLVAVSLLLKDEDDFGRKRSGTVAATTEVQAQFEGHVEAIVLALVLGLTPAEIVYGVSGRLNEIEYLADARLAGVATFGGNSRYQAEPHEAEQHGPKNAIVIFV